MQNGEILEKIVDGLSEKQKEAVQTLDESLEIIACAGSGKTRVITRRIIYLLAAKTDVKPKNIVAFTFTEAAATEMKSRIYSTAEEFLGNTLGFAEMYVGTIHAYCKNMLQEFDESYEKRQVLSGAQESAFIRKHRFELSKAPLSYENYKGIEYLYNLNSYNRRNGTEGIVGYEGAMSLIIEKACTERLTEEEQAAFSLYRKLLTENNYMTFSLLEYDFVQKLRSDENFRKKVTEDLKYLVCDEYQDVNPVQEALIKELAKTGCNICVVGDDDQLIYSFRGSNPANILEFRRKYGVNKMITLDTNYRCSEGIVNLARTGIENNTVRFNKEMNSGARGFAYEDGDITYKLFGASNDETEFVIDRIRELREAGVPYYEMAILVRAKKSMEKFVYALQETDIPFRVEVESGLMETKEAKAARAIFTYILMTAQNEDAKAILQDELRDAWEEVKSDITSADMGKAISALDDYINVVKIDILKYGEKVENEGDEALADASEETDGTEKLPTAGLSEEELKKKRVYGYMVNIQHIYLEFMNTIGIFEDLKNTMHEKMFYNLGAFSQLINDFENINFNKRPYWKLFEFDRFVDESGCGSKYCEGFLNNKYIGNDCLNIRTVHTAKGLEYTAVFMPDLNNKIFPNMFFASLYPDQLAEDRRLFYVGVTRAKKFLFLTNSHDEKSKYLTEVMNADEYIREYSDDIQYAGRTLPPYRMEPPQMTLNFTLLSDYFDCPYRFKLSSIYGFKQPITREMGYGKTIHEAVEHIHKRFLDGEPYDDLAEILDISMNMPYAPNYLKDKNKERGIKTIQKYVEENERYFGDIEFAEAPIELDLGDGISVNGRMDLVIHREVNGEKKVSVVDFKTQKRSAQENISEQQLKIYALGYEELTGRAADNIEIYNLERVVEDSDNAIAVTPVTKEMVDTVREQVKDAAESIRENKFKRRKECDAVCGKCYYRKQCRK